MGGMQYSNRLIVEGLAAIGASIDLHIFSEASRPSVTQGNIRRFDHVFRPRSVWAHLTCAQTIVREAESQRSDFVLLLDDGMLRCLGCYPFLRKAGLRYVGINSGSTLTRNNRHFRGRVNAALVRRGYRWLDLLFVAQSTAVDLRHVCPEIRARIRLLGRPMPDSLYNQAVRVEEELSLFSNKFPVLFSCSRAVEEKGISLVLRALALLRDECGKEVVNFVFAGDGPALKSWRELAQELALKQVVFVGRVEHEDLVKYFQSCYMCIFPSYYAGETFGRTWMEAFACGKPVISTETENLKYLVKDNVNGVVILPEVDSIVLGIRRALALDSASYDALSRNALETAKPYKQSAIVQELMRSLEELK